MKLKKYLYKKNIIISIAASIVYSLIIILVSWQILAYMEKMRIESKKILFKEFIRMKLTKGNIILRNIRNNREINIYLKDGLMLESVSYKTEIDGKWYKNNSYDPTSISNNNIFSIYKDRKGRMWIGTFGGGLDLAVKDKNGYHFKHFFNKTYSQKQIRTIQEDKSGWLWVGSSDGLYVFKFVKNDLNIVYYLVIYKMFI
jgi:hypothetical protein